MCPSLIEEVISFWEILQEKEKYTKKETDNALLATAQFKIEELENKISNQYTQLAKYEEIQESLFKYKKDFQIIRIKIYWFRW